MGTWAPGQTLGSISASQLGVWALLGEDASPCALSQARQGWRDGGREAALLLHPWLALNSMRQPLFIFRFKLFAVRTAR